jgi:NAD(P)-dependent dehydrogenase (short-subunit alcohol dehydrogenase family)
MFRELLPLRKGSEGMDVDQLVERAGSGNALGRLAKPEEVAQATLFLASAAAGAITGQHLVVDAGKR